MCPGMWPGMCPGMGDFRGGAESLKQDQRGERGEKKKQKDKKRKKKRKRSSSSSSSSSESLSDWRQKVWNSGFQQGGGSGWPGMPPAMPGMHPGMSPGMWPAWPPQAMGAAQNWPTQQMSGNEERGGGPVSQSGGGGQGAQGTWGSELSRETKEEPPEDGEVPIFLEPAIEEIVPVPKALLGKVIGKQAQTIIEIREKSGAFKVDARDQTSDPCLVKVAGTAEAVRKAKELIMDLVENTKNKHAGSEYVEIPRAKIGMVIGLKGAQVNEIQNQTGTKIDVDFEVDPCRCYIKGPQASAERAKEVLLTIAMQIEDDSSEYLDLPKTASGALIGAQGSRVREFQEQSGARIDVDKTGTRCRVRLSGTKMQVANAKQLVLAEVEASMPGHGRPLALEGGPSGQQPVVIPAHQPTSFPATLSESIARAKAAAQAVKTGLITSPPPPPPAPASLGQSGWYESNSLGNPLGNPLGSPLGSPLGGLNPGSAPWTGWS